MSNKKFTEEEANAQYDIAMAHLDSMLDEPEDFGSASFVKEAIVQKNSDDTFSVHYGYVIYSLEETGLRHEAIDFEAYLNEQGF